MANYRDLKPGHVEVSFYCKGCNVTVCTEVPMGEGAPSLCRKCTDPSKPKPVEPVVLEKGMDVKIKGLRGNKSIGKVVSTPEEGASVVAVMVGGNWHTYPIDKVEKTKPPVIKVYRGEGKRRKTKIL